MGNLVIGTCTATPEVSLPPTQADDFGTTGWTLTGLVVDETTGNLKLDDGEASGTALSPVYEATDYAGGYGAFRMGGSNPLGCVIRARFRSAASEAAIIADTGGALYLPWVDVFDAEGIARNDLDTQYANSALTPGAFFQVELYMRKQ